MTESLAMPASGIPQGWEIPSAILTDVHNLYVPGMNSVPEDTMQILYLFSPQYIPDQVVRTYEYQFSTDFLNEVQKPDGSMDENVINSKDPSVKQAIMPSRGGLIVDTRTFSEMWSFVLILDQILSDRKIRAISLGYVFGEPISPSGTPNPDAVLSFTRTIVKSIRKACGYNMPEDRMMVYSTQNVDFAHTENKQLYDTQNVFINSPADLLNHKQQFMTMGDEYRVQDYSDLSLDAVEKVPKKVKMLDTNESSPISMLSDIVTAIDHCDQGVMFNDSVVSHIRDQGMGKSLNPMDQALANAVRQMPGGLGVRFDTQGIDTTAPMLMSELLWKCPNIIIKPHRVNVDGNYGWPRANQIDFASNGVRAPIMSPKFQMSFMVGSAVQGICNEMCVGDLTFHYHVIAGDGITSPKRREFFRFNEFQPVIPRAPSVIETIAGVVRHYLQVHIFDVIEIMSPEFSLNVTAHMNGDVLVDLRLMAFPDPSDGTWYQTNARLGGIMNPMMGTVDSVVQNMNALYNATETLTMAKHVNEGYGNPENLPGMPDGRAPMDGNYFMPGTTQGPSPAYNVGEMMPAN